MAIAWSRRWPAYPVERACVILSAASLEDAVAEAIAAPMAGGVILFSPAQPTPPEEGDFRSRSRRFLEAAAPTERAPSVGPG